MDIRFSKLNRIYSCLVGCNKARAQFAALRNNANVQAFAKYLEVFAKLQDNLEKVSSKELSFVDSGLTFNAALLFQGVSTLLASLDKSKAVKLAKEFYSIIVSQDDASVHPLFLLTNKNDSSYLATMALASLFPTEVANVFTSNGKVTDGQTILADLSFALEHFKQDNDVMSCQVTLSGITQRISALIGAVDEANGLVSVLVPSFDLLLSDTMHKLLHHRGDLSSFLSPLLNIFVREDTDDELFKERNVFSENTSPEQIAALNNLAMHKWFDCFVAVGLGDKICYFDDKYFVAQFTVDVIKPLAENYIALFDKSIKTAYDVQAILPLELRKSKYKPTSYITKAVKQDKSCLGIFGSYNNVKLNVSALNVLRNEAPILFDSHDVAKARGDLSVETVLPLDLLDPSATPVELYTYNCSPEQVRKYEAGVQLEQGYNVMMSFGLEEVDAYRYCDLTGRVYFQTPHHVFNPNGSKNTRELIRLHDDVVSNREVDFDSEFNSDDKLIWLDIPAQVSSDPASLMDFLLDSNTYQFFAEFSEVLGNKISDVSDVTKIFTSVQDFFADGLADGQSLADKSSYTKDVATSLWKALKAKINRMEYEPEVYAGAEKFLKAVFGDLLNGRCSFTVPFDATSSVTQILSTYCGEYGLMEGSNVLSSGDTTVKDVYYLLAFHFVKSKLMKTQNIKDDRDTVKYSWMTLVYGSPIKFVEAYGEEGLVLFEEFLQENYPHAATFIQTFQNLWNNPRKYTFNNRTKVLGRIVDYKAFMPDGFVFQYTPIKSCEGYCSDFIKLKFNYSQVGYDLLNRNVTYTDKKKRKSTDRSFLANIIHSVDALFVRESLLMCETLPSLKKFICRGLWHLLSKYPEYHAAFYDAFCHIVNSSSTCNTSSKKAIKEAKQAYYAIKNNPVLFSKFEYIAEHKDELIVALKSSRFTSALWLIPFAGYALNDLAEDLGKHCEVFSQLADIAKEIIEYAMSTIDEACALTADSTENPTFMLSQLLETVVLIPETKVSLITLHDSFHTLPMNSKLLRKVVRLQYAKFAESDLVEHIMGSFFGDDFVIKEGLNFLNHKEKQELAAKVSESVFILTL